MNLQPFAVLEIKPLRPTQNNPVETGEIIFSSSSPDQPVGQEQIQKTYLEDETQCMRKLLDIARLPGEQSKQVREKAAALVMAVRANRKRKGGLDAFLKKYDLSSQEGVVLMCLAEALLRVPDADTADRLIADKLATGNWQEHMGTSDSVFVNASTWGLMLTGKLIRPDELSVDNPANFVSRMITRMGEPVVRASLRQAMKIMGHQFVMGRNISEAVRRSLKEENRIFRYSFDMLGEAALTSADALRYLQAYSKAIATLGEMVGEGGEMEDLPSISVKLSALFPRYELSQRGRVLDQLTPRLKDLALQARAAGIALTVDAEEADRLQLSLEIIERVYRDPELDGWGGLGLAVQAYQKRSLEVVRWLCRMSSEVGQTLCVRLVKGAYWDTEIKRAQEQGLSAYPVFTRKQNTDVAYLACARTLLEQGEFIYPQFATHNAHTVASIISIAGERKFEFQRLHGMGEELYDEIVPADRLHLPCRVYAPVGRHEDLLPYLVRRLLENGANTSFVHRLVDENAPIAELVEDPVLQVDALEQIPHPQIRLPQHMFGKERQNSTGVNLADPLQLQRLSGAIAEALSMQWEAAPIVDGVVTRAAAQAVYDPADRRRQVGLVVDASEDQVDQAITCACRAQRGWNSTPAARRAEILDKTADLFDEHMAELMALCVREAGKSLPDTVSEWREAVDFLRFYAARCRQDFSGQSRLPGPTGELNQISLHGRGVFVCISPWNFPLAIFTGQVAAALAAGNAVLAKPAEQTPLVAALVVRLFHKAGVPGSVLHFLPGEGASVGARAVADPRVAGVAFTGSTETARLINQAMAARPGPIGTLIAETGGQNAMIVDNSALPEQVVKDVVISAFNSAGQRCSALRVLFLQKEIAPRVIELLTGCMDELVIGDAALLATDVGPVIDRHALGILEQHVSMMTEKGRVIHRCKMPEDVAHGSFLAPVAVEIDDISLLDKEVFGPVLHIVRYEGSQLDQVLEQINQTGYGLTLGVHSRIDGTARYINRRVQVGNVYVNRNMVGAVVGVQPFGGCGLSGTGPKAGGPHYLHRFATERTLTINTAAVGGDTSLLSLSSESQV